VNRQSFVPAVSCSPNPTTFGRVKKMHFLDPTNNLLTFQTNGHCGLHIQGSVMKAARTEALLRTKHFCTLARGRSLQAAATRHARMHARMSHSPPHHHHHHLPPTLFVIRVTWCEGVRAARLCTHCPKKVPDCLSPGIWTVSLGPRYHPFDCTTCLPSRSMAVSSSPSGHAPETLNVHREQQTDGETESARAHARER